MTTGRRPARAPARALWAALTALALLLRIAIPSEWMLMSDATGTHFIPCSGIAMSEGGAMAAMKPHGAPAPGKDDHAPERPCDFAGTALAATTPVAPSLALAAPPIFATPLPARDMVSVGRGLAAPPPPATGPPLLA